MDICILSPPATPSLEDTNSSCSTDSEHQPSKNSLTVSCTRSRRETAINCIGLDYLCVLVRGAIFCSFVRHSVILEWTFEYSPIHYVIGSHEFRRDSRVILQWGTNRQPTGEKIPIGGQMESLVVVGRAVRRAIARPCLGHSVSENKQRRNSSNAHAT